MPYGVNDNSKMQLALASIRNAMGGSQEPNPEDERVKIAKLQALQRISAGGPQINQERVKAFLSGFQQ